MKSQIELQTIAPFVIAYSILCLILLGNNLSELIANWEKLAVVGAFSVGLSLLQDLIPKSFKEALVFFRLRDRLPGTRAFDPQRRFSSVIEHIEVVDIALRSTLTRRHQDRLFYRIYDKYREKGNVKHYSFRYLQWRELASTSLICAFIGFSAVSYNAGFFSWPSMTALMVGTSICICSIVAARNSSALLIDYVLLAELLDKTGPHDDVPT